MALSAQQVLELWRKVMAASLGRDHADLTARQFALLLHVYLTPPPHTVRGLSAALRLSKPVITRALDRLGRLDYVRRKRDETDRRNVLIQRTIKGSVYLREFGDLAAEIAAPMQPPPSGLIPSP